MSEWVSGWVGGWVGGWVTFKPCSSLIFPGARASSFCRLLACSFSALVTSLWAAAASALNAPMSCSRDC